MKSIKRFVLNSSMKRLESMQSELRGLYHSARSHVQTESDSVNERLLHFFDPKGLRVTEKENHTSTQYYEFTENNRFLPERH